MSGASSLVAAAVATGVGAYAIGVLAEQQLGGEMAAIGQRLHLPQTPGGGERLLAFVDAIDPGASTRLKTAAMTTAIGGAFVAVVTFVLVSSFLGVKR